MLSSTMTSDFRGMVAAVVGDDEDIEFILRIIGFADALDQTSDDVFLVLAGDQDSITKLLFPFREHVFMERSDDRVEKEVEEIKRKKAV